MNLLGYKKDRGIDCTFSDANSVQGTQVPDGSVVICQRRGGIVYGLSIQKEAWRRWRQWREASAFKEELAEFILNAQGAGTGDGLGANEAALFERSRVRIGVC